MRDGALPPTFAEKGAAKMGHPSVVLGQTKTGANEKPHFPQKVREMGHFLSPILRAWFLF
jgi:hypothetical protein